MTFRYKDVEQATAGVLKVEQSQMGAFRARMRHLRNLGSPTGLQAPGSGKHISYSADQAFELLIALQLESLGLVPRTAATIAASIVRQVPLRGTLDHLKSGKDIYAAVDPSMPEGWTGLFTRKAFREYVATPPMRFSMVNLSACGQMLDHALKKSSVHG